MPEPTELSRQLRLAQSPDLNRRRGIVALSLLGAAMGAVVGAYQTGLLRRLPDLPFEPFDATTVDKAPYAYSRLQTPDGLLMVGSYALTAILAGAGGLNRVREQPALPILMALKLAYDIRTTLTLSQEEWAETRKLCGWCSVGALATLGSALLAVPEALRALGLLDRRG